MPHLLPQNPTFPNGSEREVWEALRDQLGPDDILMCSIRFSEHRKDHEVDIAVIFPGAGVVVAEVKGSQVWCEDGSWWIERQRKAKQIDPVTQAREAMYAMRTWVMNGPAWGSRGHIRWGHAVVLPYTQVTDDFEVPDARRWQVMGRDDMDHLASRLRAVVAGQDNDKRLLTTDDAELIADIVHGQRGSAQRDLIGAAAENADLADRLTEQQSVILDAITLLNRVEVRGGAGSGKTWLAIEQARRLTRKGKRVALACYSRGLAAWMQRRVATFDRKDRPAYVGTFHNLGVEWGAPTGSDDDSDFWETTLPRQMVDLGSQQPEGKLFDAIVIDEAQDFADAWWPAAIAALRDEDADGIYVFSDEGQRVFSRYGGLPAGLVPLVLDHNLRNTKQIGETFSTLAPIRMRLGDLEGPDVTFVECAGDDALSCADDEVDRLLGAGWRHQDIALLATGSRHPEQTQRQGQGQDAYWASFWDDEQVFYGHVLGFKGLERPAVVLAINESEPRARSTERLYVGLSRARDQLVVCGDPEVVAEVGGASVLRRLRQRVPI